MNSDRDYTGGAICHEGDEKIILGFDIGTTQTAVAYTHLYPGRNPQVRVVNKWPGQEDAAGDSKIPTLVAYDGGRPVAYGAEAEEAASEDSLFLARWFKLHLHPDSMKRSTELQVPSQSSSGSTLPKFEIPPLPSNVSLKQVYAHFMTYIFNRACNFFKSNTVDGTRIWSRLGPKVVIVLATPNGWDTSQQAFLKEAAVLAGILPSNYNDSRLQFVTEAEASVHYAIEKANSEIWLQTGTQFAVCDAGGSTVDTTLYICKGIKPKLVIEEVCASECVQAGAVFIDRAGESVIRRKLKSSKFAQDMYIMDILRDFEKRTKRKFDGTQPNSIIRFGRDFDNDRSVGVIKGRVTLLREEVEEAFSASVPYIIASTTKLLSWGQTVKHLLLVGGMGESPYLRKKLAETYQSNGIKIVTVDDSTKKAAAEGAVIWYIKQLVTARAARASFGMIIRNQYDPNSILHQSRKHLAFVDKAGKKMLSGVWASWVKKNQVIGANRSESFVYDRVHTSITSLGTFAVSVYAYDGEGNIEWGYNEQGQLAPSVRHVCNLRADMSALRPSLKRQVGPTGQVFWIIRFSIEVMLGGTSLKARLVWHEKGTRKEGPVTIIPNSIY